MTYNLATNPAWENRRRRRRRRRKISNNVCSKVA
jgi:hypothetical protein